MALLADLVPSPLATASGLRDIAGLVDRIDTGDVVGARAATTALAEVDRLISRLQSVRLALVAEADRSAVADASGLTGTSAWLAASTRTDGAQAARDVRLATALDTALPATREALAAGDVTTHHARVIEQATAQLPEGLGPAQRAAIETSLVAQARRLDPGALRRAARRALTAAHATQSEVDAHEDRVLRTEEDNAYERTTLTWHDNRDGTTSGHFTVPTLAAAILVKTVQQMASPRRFADRAARAGARTAAAQLEAFRVTDWRQRYGQAFVELLEHLPTDRLSGKVAATVVVTVDHDRLRDQLGAGHLDTGIDLSGGEARRVACAAGILPAVLGGDSMPLDLGRTARFFTESQRVALATVYDECAAESCDRPYAWSELHHEDPWHRGGRTDLELAVPLCGFHHRRVHDARYAHRVTAGERGRKVVTFVRRT